MSEEKEKSNYSDLLAGTRENQDFLNLSFFFLFKEQLLQGLLS